MNIQEYIQWTATTAVYPKDREEEYLSLGLLSELGEVAALLKREIRDSVKPKREELLKELGDVAWYLARQYGHVDYWPTEPVYIWGGIETLISGIAYGISAVRYFHKLLDKLGFTLQEVIDTNVAKLESRKERGVLQGSGGER